VLLPAQARRLPAELARIDAYLDDERFIAPWRVVFSARLGRPSVPVATLLRLLYLKHRYQLGYESLCAEVADSIGWRRFARIPLDQPVPHPTTLVKLRGDTTVMAADIDHPTDADLMEHAVRKLGRLVRRIRGRGAATRTAFRDRSRAAGRRLKQISRTLRRRTGQAPAEVDRLTAQVAAIARRALAQAERVGRNARRARANRSSDGWLRRLVTRLEETTAATRRLLEQTRQRLAGNRVIPDRLVSLADPDARPIRKGKPGRPTEFGYTVLLAECERGFIATHHTHKGNPGDAAQLVPAVQDVVAVTGRPPGTVVGDRGFGTAANDTALAALGVQRIGLAAPASPARPGLATSRPDGSSGCAPGGSGSRPASASSSAPSGWVVRGCAAWAARRSGSGWGSSPTTSRG
jgi:IS5 family transposase